MSSKEEIIQLLELENFIDDLSLIDNKYSEIILEFLEKIYKTTNDLQEFDSKKSSQLSKLIKILEED